MLGFSSCCNRRHVPSEGWQIWCASCGIYTPLKLFSGEFPKTLDRREFRTKYTLAPIVKAKECHAGRRMPTTGLELRRMSQSPIRMWESLILISMCEFLTSSLQFLHLFIFPLFHFYILEVRVTCGSAALCSCRRLSITCVKTWRAVFRSMPRPCSCMCPSLAFSLSSKSFSRT